MAPLSLIPPSRWSTRTLVVVAIVCFALALAAGGTLLWFGGALAGPPIVPVYSPPATSTPQMAVIPQSGPEPQVEYTTDSGKGTSEGAVNSLLRISVHMPEPNGHPETALSASVSAQLLDEHGQPAWYGGKPADPFAMFPAFETDVWSYYGSMPGRPGTYYLRVVMSTQGDSLDTPEAQANKQYVFDLKSAPLHVLAESGPPLTSGYVFARDSNLWLMSTDTKRQRRITFFTPPDEDAYGPAWSPDGKLVAFAFSPKTDQSEIPSTDIWVVNPDGTGARELVKHGDNEELKDPAWSSDGRYLYFTVEQTDPNQTTYNALGVPQGNVRIDRFDMQSGARSQLIAAGEMPGTGSTPANVLYLEDVYEASSDPSQAGYAGQQMVKVNVDGSGRTVLVASKEYVAINYPTISPDGKWIAFSAIYVPPVGEHGNFDLLSWLGIRPQVALAHGLPWDVFLLPAKGGKPVKLSKQSDDQPRPAWLSNTSLTYMGSYGMYSVEIDAGGKPLHDPRQIGEGAPHGGLTWHGP